MFEWFFKNKSTLTDLSSLGIDMHSHIIPGIDDGVETIAEALVMVKKLEELGYKAIFTTPHIMWDCYRNTPEIILAGVEHVNSSLDKTDTNLRIHAAAEYFLDEHFHEMLENNERLLTLPGNRLLVELPYSTPLLNTSETLFKIIEKGYQPVLAHPERYTYFHSEPQVYKKLCDQGCELQLNILSLTNQYGEHIRKMAEWLLKHNLITLAGTDAHKPQHLDLIKKLINSKWLRSYPFKNQDILQI
jgi:protein-tyrosine phosphatase